MTREDYWKGLRMSGAYSTPPNPKRSLLDRVFGRFGLWYHGKSFRVVSSLSREARKGDIDYETWADHQLEILKAIESCGAEVEIEGAHHAAKVEGPCVCISNHMSTVETLLLPSILQAHHEKVTLVVKQSLMDYPVFGHILKRLGVIPVGRTNPREDLKQVLTRGAEFLDRGYMVIVFPQATRDTVFDPALFNSIGVKLAKRAKAQILPIALKTDFQQPGKLVKDFGPIDPSRTLRFRVGEPFYAGANAKADHQRVVDFVRDSLMEWDPANVADAASTEA